MLPPHTQYPSRPNPGAEGEGGTHLLLLPKARGELSKRPVPQHCQGFGKPE